MFRFFELNHTITLQYKQNLYIHIMQVFFLCAPRWNFWFVLGGLKECLEFEPGTDNNNSVYTQLYIHQQQFRIYTTLY